MTACPWMFAMLDTWMSPPPDEGSVHAPPEAQHAWFVVGTTKFAVMSLATFGLYQYYWFFMQWQKVQLVHREDVWPAARTVFAPLFCYPLFERMIVAAWERGVTTRANAALMAAVYFVLSFAYKLPDPYWLMSLGTVLPLLVAQSVVNALPDVLALPREQRNETFSGMNKAGIVAGTIFLSLVVLAVVLPEDVLDSSRTPAEMVEATNLDLPKETEPGLVLERVYLSEGAFTFRYRLTEVEPGTADVDAMYAALRPVFIESDCSDTGERKQLLDMGMVLSHVFHASNGEHLTTVDVSARDCAPGADAGEEVARGAMTGVWPSARGPALAWPLPSRATAPRAPLHSVQRPPASDVGWPGNRGGCTRPVAATGPGNAASVLPCGGWPFATACGAA